MDAAPKAFWEAVGADGPVAIEDLPERIDDVLVKHPEFIRLEAVNVFIFFSGAIMHGNATQAAVDLVKRSNGFIGIIYDTPAFKAVLPFVKLADTIGNLSIAAKIVIESRDVLQREYGKYVDIQNLSSLVGQVSLRRESLKLYNCISSHFAHHVEGSVVTVTPEANSNSVYAQFEVPHIGNGIRPDPDTGLRRIKHVNGVDAEVFDVTLDRLPSLEGTPYRASERLLETIDGNRVSEYEPLRMQFDTSFKEQFREAGGRVFADAPVDG